MKPKINRFEETEIKQIPFRGDMTKNDEERNPELNNFVQSDHGKSSTQENAVNKSPRENLRGIKSDSGPGAKTHLSFKKQHYDVCIAGAGLSGAVIAEQYASQLNQSVLVVEKRDHIAGNCYDYIDEETNIRVSKYGAHLFHTKYDRVWDYVQQFSKWTKYEHEVRLAVMCCQQHFPFQYYEHISLTHLSFVVHKLGVLSLT